MSQAIAKKNPASSPMPQEKEEEIMMKGQKNIAREIAASRLPATPGTSGRPRAPPSKEAAASATKAESLSSPLEEFRATGRNMAGQAQEQFVNCKHVARAWFAELEQKGTATATTLRVRSGELQEKGKVKAVELRAKSKDLEASLRAWAAPKTAGVRAWARELQAAAQTHLAGWLEEVREVGWWKHPAPPALICFVTLFLLFLGCSLASSWPVTLPPPPHRTPASEQQEPNHIPEALAAVLQASIAGEEMGRDTASAATVPLEPVHGLEAFTWHQENTERYLAARAALQEHQFGEAHQILVELSNDGALEAQQWGNFGNFSRANFLTDLGATLVSVGQYHEAVPLLASGLRGRPSGFALNALGIAYRNLGDYRSAMGAFQTATQVAPQNPKAWSNLGVVAMELGHLQQADDAFYYAAEAHGADAELDETLVNNVKVLQNRALGRRSASEEEVAALELWYENEENPEE